MKIKENMNTNILRGYDIRGVVPTEIDIDTIVMEEVIPDHSKNEKTFKALMYL